MEKAPVLKLERVFRATPERLWSFWTDPKKYAKWLNPNGVLVIHEFDVRVGGRIRFDMPQPNGDLNPQSGVFHVLEPYTKLVSGEPDRSFLLTARFEPVDASHTRLRVEVEGVPRDFHEMAKQGWGMCFDKLARESEVPEGGFVIERTFKAAPEKVWRMWTTKEGIEAWWVPSARDMGFDMRVRELDARVGGGFAFEMTNKEFSLVNRGTYTDVRPYTDLAWTWHYAIFLKPGEEGYDVPIAIAFARTPAGGTTMRFVQGPLRTPEFTEGSRQGVQANFEKLAKALGE
jgi:uncharacterized protein YndB with AHSA1/START domain